jgi:hypothetical protein
MMMKAAMNFATPREDGTVPFLLNTHWTGTQPRPVMVDMHDARAVASELSFEREGFVLGKIDIDKVDFADPESLETHWYPAVEELIRKVTGASFVTLFAGPLLRYSNSESQSKASTVSAPARAVHSDLWATYDLSIVPNSPAPDRAVKELKERFGDESPKKWKIFNYWQMISPPPQDTPLAVCALNSVSPDDLLDGRGRYCPEDGPEPALPEPGDDVDAPITFFKESAAQRWYYVSNMQPGESLIFQTLDPEAGPLKGRVPHCAFDIEPRPAGAVPRNSVEIRAIVAFD